MCTHEDVRTVGSHLVFSDDMYMEVQHPYIRRVPICVDLIQRQLAQHIHKC